MSTVGAGASLASLAALAPQSAFARLSGVHPGRALLAQAGLGLRQAAGLQVPKRLVLIPMLNGTPKDTFFPKNDSLPMVSSPFEAFKSKIQFVRGLDMHETHDHIAVRCMFTGADIDDYSLPLKLEGSASVDQVLAKHYTQADPTARRSIHVSACPADDIIRYKEQGRGTFYFTDTEAVDYFANPANAYDTYFPKDDGGDNNKLAELRKRVLAISEAELGDLRGVLSKSKSELGKLNTHKTSLDVLKAATDAGGGNCGDSPIASVEALRGKIGTSEEKAYNQSHYSDLIDAQLDNIVRALSCGLTRVATMQWNSADGNVGVPIGSQRLPHHDTSHGSLTQFAEVQLWYAQKVAKLLEALDAQIDPLDPSGTATLLDNTCVVWMAECNPDHGSWDVPVMYAGSWGGALKTGSISEVDGASNRHFLKTLANIAGVDPSQSKHFGDEDLPDLKGDRA